MIQKFDSGLLCGRFQTFTIGHESLLNSGLRLCDRMFVLIGSSQESGTKRNPFNISTRIDMINEIYRDYDNVFVYALPDLTNEEDITEEWGRYVLAELKRYLHKAPELMVYGNDESRSKWFNPNDIKNTSEFIVPRSRIPISATMARDYMVKDMREEWMGIVNPKLHKMYDRLRGELLEVDAYKNIKIEE